MTANSAFITQLQTYIRKNEKINVGKFPEPPTSLRDEASRCDQIPTKLQETAPGTLGISNPGIFFRVANIFQRPDGQLGEDGEHELRDELAFLRSLIAARRSKNPNGCFTGDGDFAEEGFSSRGTSHISEEDSLSTVGHEDEDSTITEEDTSMMITDVETTRTDVSETGSNKREESNSGALPPNSTAGHSQTTAQTRQLVNPAATGQAADSDREEQAAQSQEIKRKRSGQNGQFTTSTETGAPRRAKPVFPLLNGQAKVLTDRVWRMLKSMREESS